MIVPCLRCGGQFDRIRSSGRFCPGCRLERNREASRRRYAVLAQTRQDMHDIMGAYILGGMDPGYVESLEGYVDDHIDWLASIPAGEAAVDRMPEGASSTFGPEDGQSTTDEALSAHLDELGALAETHPWFIDNPHWNSGMHDAA